MDVKAQRDVITIEKEQKKEGLLVIVGNILWSKLNCACVEKKKKNLKKREKEEKDLNKIVSTYLFLFV